MQGIGNLCKKMSLTRISEACERQSIKGLKATSERDCKKNADNKSLSGVSGISESAKKATAIKNQKINTANQGGRGR